MAVLRIIEGQRAGFSLELGASPVTIGRESSNTIHINDPKASRTHVTISWTKTKNRYILKDMLSSNGTWDDNGKLDRLELVDGALFRIGSTYFRFDDPASAQHITAAATAASTTTEGTRVDTLISCDGVISHSETKRLVETLGGTEKSSLFEKQSGDADVLSRANEFLILMHEVVIRSLRAQGRDALFEILDDVAADALDGDRCAVFLPSPEGWVLWPAHERRLRARFGATPFSQTVLTHPQVRQESLLSTAPTGSSGNKETIDLSHSMMQAGVHSVMTAPMRIGDDVQALIYVDRLDSEDGFSRQDLEFLSAVADQLAIRLFNCDHVAELQAEVTRLKAEPSSVPDMIGDSPAMEEIRIFLAKAAPTSSPILIFGESGSGKEVVARAAHAGSQLSDKPLQIINCAAIAESLVESTLFGHVKGAFTGADETRPGIFEIADGGTLFLDELGELPLGVQAKLLRVIEQGEVQRLGDHSTRTVNVRMIAATNRTLEDEVEAGNFREDLYHRLNVLSVELPPLRDRPDDLEQLMDHFLTDCARRLEQPVKRLSTEARAVLLAYGWPGNVRQLRNTLERTVILSNDEVILPSDLPNAIVGAEVHVAPGRVCTLADMERAHITHVLKHCDGNKKATAEILGIDRSTLYAKLRLYNA